MTTPTKEVPAFEFDPASKRPSDDESTAVEPGHLNGSVDGRELRDRLRVETHRQRQDTLSARFDDVRSPSSTREHETRLQDDLAVARAERITSAEPHQSIELHRSRSRAPEPLDEFDTATNPVHETARAYNAPEHPTTSVAKFLKYVHHKSLLIRYFTYIVPVAVILLTPVFIGAYAPVAKNSNVGGVELLWFGVWLEIIWLTLWLARLVAKCIPVPLGWISSIFTNNSKKWRDLGKQLELPATLFFWWLGILVSFLPTMTNHHIGHNKATKYWERNTNKVLISIFVGATLNFVEKIIIQLIAISFHLRTYADRIEVNKFQIGSLTKLYVHSKKQIDLEDAAFEEKQPGSGAKTPAMYAAQAQDAINKTIARFGDVAGTVAGDFTGRKVTKSGHPGQVILSLLHTTGGSQVLARRLYRTFVSEDRERELVDDEPKITTEDIKRAFDSDEEAEAAFSMFDKDMNGDISMEELEAVCVEIGRERKAITASLKDLDSVVGKFDDVLFFVVVVVTLLVLLSLISSSTAGVLTSAGSAVLALSWLFSATAQEFLQSCVFVFVKHPFDVGDRVSIYGNTGSMMRGDDYFVKEISLLYTEFKKMEGHVVQAPNSYLNTLFILNQRRSGGLAEAVPQSIAFGTTIEQIDALRQSLLDFVKTNKREFQGQILTELREVTEVYSLTLNVVFFYKSNWQNELLRLQRRNMFISALMEGMKEHNIVGPRQNQAGWRPEAPYYMHLPSNTPSNAFQHGNPPDSNGSQASFTAEPLQQTPTVHRPSILRRGPSTGQLGQARRDSVSQMARKVDFSLGMKDVGSGELADAFEDPARDKQDYRTVIRDANNKAASNARQNSTSLDREGGGRSSATHRTSVSSNGTDGHRNRFLGRLGRNGRSIDLPRDSLAEEGQAPSFPMRRINSEAVRTDSNLTEPFPSVGGR